MEFTLFASWYKELDYFYPQLKDFPNINFQNYEVEKGVKVIIHSLVELKTLQQYAKMPLLVDFDDMTITIDD